jgi:serine/threonine-protein kinase HipA
MSTPQNRDQIYVYTDNHEHKDPIFKGILSVSMVRGKEIFSFEYDSDFLKSDFAIELDPNLKLFKGTQYLPNDKTNFGIFMDSAPDRWGRVLMDRREAANSILEDRSARKLQESDYLLGVFDETRMGALRFKVNINGPFLDDNIRHTTPPFTSLRELEYASMVIEDDALFEQSDYHKQLNLLVAPGSSLGGARPKANVQDPNKNLWIAKFPSKMDSIDQGAWEYVVYQLAIRCGIKMSESKISTYYSDRHTFLTRRFDRDEYGQRIHFVSAMTLLGYQDGANANSGVSYLELVDLISQRGASIEEDLEQLWRRIVFNICVSNTDDHPRNHGFILTNSGICLSPAYDLNPNPKGHGLTLNIDEHNNALDVDLTLKVAPYFRLTHATATEIIADMKSEISNWMTYANDINLSRREQQDMAPAFRM